MAQLRYRIFSTTKRATLNDFSALANGFPVPRNIGYRFPVSPSHVINTKEQNSRKYGDSTGNVKCFVVGAKTFMQPTYNKKQVNFERFIYITSNSNHRLKSAVDMPICVLKRGHLCLHLKLRPDSCIKTR